MSEQKFRREKVSVEIFYQQASSEHTSEAQLKSIDVNRLRAYADA